MIPLAAIPLGGGSGFIDAAVNAHVSLNRGVRYMGWLHASWAVGAALGPQVVVLSLAATDSWRAAFAAMSAAYLATGLVVATRPQDGGHPADKSTTSDRRDPAIPRVRRRTLLILAGLFLVAAGLEGTAGNWSYTQLTIGRGLSASAASWAASLFWTGLAGGRIALGLLGGKATPTPLLESSAAPAGPAAVASWVGPPRV